VSIPPKQDGSESRAEPVVATRQSCLPRVIAVILVIASGGLGVWNFVVHSPFAETNARPAFAAEISSPHAMVHPYSVNTFLSQEVEPWKREKTVEMISLAGIGWIKEGFPWSELEPARGSHWDPKFQQDSWKKYDEIVDLAEEYGIRIIARLDHTPEWAREEGTDHHTPPADVEDFGRFVETFVDRYSGRVQYIQIWNEPNLSREWGGDIDPEGYFELLREAYTRAKAADPDVVVLSAPMAMTNERSDRAIPEFEYWSALYELGAGDYFDIMTATGYGIDQPPEEPPAGDMINLRRIERLRVIKEAYGDDNKPVWLTEYGWNASPPEIPEERLDWGRVTDQEQAEWTSRGITWMTEHWDWFGVSSIWYFRQVGVIPPDAPEYYFAMVDLEFTPRPVYLSVKNDARERRMALPGTYGPLEGPVRYRGTWARFDDPDAPFGQSIVASDTGAELRIEFSGTEVSLNTSTLADTHGRIYVELNGEPVNDKYLPDSVDGRSYIELDNVGRGGSEIPIINGYGTDRPQESHELVISLDQNSQLAVSAGNVGYTRSYVQFSLFAMVVILGFALAGWLFRR
jgi:polysaccharide biosynthesis protein PslG